MRKSPRGNSDLFILSPFVPWSFKDLCADSPVYEDVFDSSLCGDGASRLRGVARAAWEKEPELAAWLDAAVRQIECGTDPREALALRRRRGRPKVNLAELARQAQLVTDIHLYRRSGMTLETAIWKVEEHRGVPEGTLKAHYRKRGELLAWIPWIFDWLHYELYYSGWNPVLVLSQDREFVVGLQIVPKIVPAATKNQPK